MRFRMPRSAPTVTMPNLSFHRIADAPGEFGVGQQITADCTDAKRL
jgi:hypothetical protein